MNLFGETISPPAHLPITATDEALGAAVVSEIERTILWRAIVRQERRVVIDGSLASRLELEPVASIVGLTMWTPNDAAAVVEADSYHVVTRDPAGTIITPAPGANWPAPARAVGSFTLNYFCGWVVTPETSLNAGDAVNEVPASVRLLVERAVAFRAGSGLGVLKIGSLSTTVAKSYETDRLPLELVSIGRHYAYRPGLFVG